MIYRGRMGVSRLDHINIDTCRMQETIDFYTDVLGLELRPKPSNNPGAWLYLGDTAVVHLNNIDDDRSQLPTGSFNHIAFAANDAFAITGSLERRGLKFRLTPRSDVGITQVFVRDPNGILVEINIADPN